MEYLEIIQSSYFKLQQKFPLAVMAFGAAIYYRRVSSNIRTGLLHKIYWNVRTKSQKMYNGEQLILALAEGLTFAMFCLGVGICAT
mmetsp:Transcript_904/g.549  ORF Transcript_904/g.549 Transcript_904/m.549 type:complete len:86 (-) Transcript_904:138-395(-)